MKWLDYGLKAQADYRKNNRKLPVFSMEWILMQNYENISTSNFDDSEYRQKVIFLLTLDQRVCQFTNLPRS